MKAQNVSISPPARGADSPAIPKAFRRRGECVPLTQITDTVGGTVPAVVAGDGSWLPSKLKRSRARAGEPPVNQPADAKAVVPDSIRYLGLFIPSFLP